MSFSVNTNAPSLNAQRNLNANQGRLSTALQRLSSGLRVNSAKDDAAGLAIAARFTAQIRGTNQAARNANDGISVLQVAEGALNEITSNLQRIRELAVQSGNASNSASDREKLNNEAKQLVAEIDRVATNTNFNGLKLLDGTFTAQALQVGANAGGSNVIEIKQIASARSNSLGVGSNSSFSTTVNGTSTVDSNAIASAGLITINGYNVGTTSSDGVSFSNASGSAIAKASAINAITANTGVIASVSTTVLTGTVETGQNDDNSISVNGVNIGTVQQSADTAATVDNFVAAVNSVSSTTGVTARVLDATAGTYELTAADGRNINLDQDESAVTQGDSFINGDFSAQATLSLTSTNSNGITLGGDSATVASVLGLTATYGQNTATESVGAGVSSLDLSTTQGASDALSILDSAIENVANSRASLGAYQNRLESTITNLNIASENLTTSRGRIEDADFAAETAELSRAQVLQQAGTAILAQANALPQSVLSLLG